MKSASEFDQVTFFLFAVKTNENKNQRIEQKHRKNKSRFLCDGHVTATQAKCINH